MKWWNTCAPTRVSSPFFSYHLLQFSRGSPVLQKYWSYPNVVPKPILVFEIYIIYILISALILDLYCSCEIPIHCIFVVLGFDTYLNKLIPTDIDFVLQFVLDNVSFLMWWPPWLINMVLAKYGGGGEINQLTLLCLKYICLTNYICSSYYYTFYT